jgi:DNA-binding response OmpR family regulator
LSLARRDRLPNIGRGGRQLQAREPMSQQQQRVILIVEDEAEILEVIASSLKRRQYRVATATNFGDAQRALAEAGGPVDIILTDVRLPDGDGLDLVRQVCGQEAPRPRMIVMTGHLDRQSVDGALTSGAEAVLLKPFKLTTLIERINSPAEEGQPAALSPPGS